MNRITGYTPRRIPPPEPYTIPAWAWFAWFALYCLAEYLYPSL